VLISASVRAPETAEELLTPGVAALLDRLDVQSRKLRSGKLPGERRSKRRGQSVEFDDFRPYVVGDDLRHLDWNAFARLDRFVIKLFRAEEDLAVTIVLDGSASMYAGEGETAGGEPLDSKLVYAARLAMGLGSIALARQNRVSVLRFGGSRLGRLPACRGRRSIERLGRFLLDGLHEPFDPAASRHDFNGWLKEVGRSRRGRGVVVLLSDLLVRGDALPGLRSLVAADRAGTDGAVLRVLSPSELDQRLARFLQGCRRRKSRVTRRALSVVQPGSCTSKSSALSSASQFPSSLVSRQPAGANCAVPLVGVNSNASADAVQTRMISSSAPSGSTIAIQPWFQSPSQPVPSALEQIWTGSPRLSDSDRAYWNEATSSFASAASRLFWTNCVNAGTASVVRIASTAMPSNSSISVKPRCSTCRGGGETRVVESIHAPESGDEQSIAGPPVESSVSGRAVEFQRRTVAAGVACAIFAA